MRTVMRVYTDSKEHPEYFIEDTIAAAVVLGTGGVDFTLGDIRYSIPIGRVQRIEQQQVPSLDTP